MIKVTSKRTLTFPKLKWAIEKGEEKTLPEGKEAQEAILAHWAISEVGQEAGQKNGKDKKDAKDEGDEK